MNHPDKVLTVLEPPPGGWERLRSRRHSALRWVPTWWALASGSAAAVAWFAIASGNTPVHLQLSGARLIGERSQGVGVQLLGSGRAVTLPTASSDVHIYWIEPAPPGPAPAK